MQPPLVGDCDYDAAGEILKHMYPGMRTPESEAETELQTVSLKGAADAGAPRRHVVTDQPVIHKPGRCEMRPATVISFDASGREVVSFKPATHSARVRTLAQADGLILIPTDADNLPAGSLVEFLPFAVSCSGKAMP